MQSYIITLRKASHNGDDIIAHQVGIDVLLETNAQGRLVFPDEIFQQAKAEIEKAEANGQLEV